MQRIASFALVAAGCGFHHGTAPGGPVGDAPDSDAVDSAVAGPDAVPCIGTLKNVCFTTVPPASIALAAGILDTDTEPMCSTAFTTECVIQAIAIDVAGGTTIQLRGNRPLVLAAEQTITIDGTLDASSTVVPDFTAAACNWVSCVLPTRPQAGDGQLGTGHSSGGGGAGGSFAALGGNGGTASSTGGRVPKNGGTAGAIPDLTTLHGGCEGEDGASSGTGAGGGGADSGGVIYLVAGQHITISATGRVFASGAAGEGGDILGGGGGGGGSGGMIALEALMIDVAGIIAANGGGGGGGGGATKVGTKGDEGTTTLFMTPAAGGAAGDNMAGTGGNGGIANPLAGATPTAAPAGGGGGGGGAAGLVWVKGALTGTQISPGPTLH